MVKENNWIFWIVGIVIVFLILTQTNLLKKQEFGIGVHYYNDGKEVFPTKFLGFSIVTPPGGTYNQIGFSISASSSGKSYSNIKVNSAIPTQFFSALPTTIQTLAVGESKTLWTSSLINTAQFESLSQPVRFQINISAKDDYTGETISAISYKDLTIIPECVSETNIQFCSRLGKTCDSVTANDNCGVSRTVNCGTCGTGYTCSVGNCICTSHFTYSCYSNDVYWYNGCGALEDKKTECGTSGYTGNNYCYDNNVYRDYITIGCSGSSCTSSTSKVKQTECLLGCLNGVCNPTSCDQETATVATACGGLSTGTYQFIQDYDGSSNCLISYTNFNDGDWDTYVAATSGCDPAMIVNYTKPAEALISSSSWLVGDYCSLSYALAIPAGCWNWKSNLLQFRAIAEYGPGNRGTIWQCYDGTWVTLRDTCTSAYRVYEEKMNWGYWS